MTRTEKTSDRRGEERSDCALDGKIELPNHLVLACTVKDLSQTGARIQIDPSAKVPDEFDLLIPAIPEADQRFKVKLVWRRGDEIGGAFVMAGGKSI